MGMRTIILSLALFASFGASGQTLKAYIEAAQALVHHFHRQTEASVQAAAEYLKRHLKVLGYKDTSGKEIYPTSTQTLEAGGQLIVVSMEREY